NVEMSHGRGAGRNAPFVVDLMYEGARLRAASTDERIVDGRRLLLVTTREGYFVAWDDKRLLEPLTQAIPHADRDRALGIFRSLIPSATAAVPPSNGGTTATDVPRQHALPALLDEFRAALQAEMEAARSSGANAVSLVNGKRIGPPVGRT